MAPNRPESANQPPAPPLLGGLGRTLFAWFVLIALPPLILAGAAGYHNATQSLTTAAGNALSTSLAMKQELLEVFFQQHIKALSLQANSTNTILLVEELGQARKSTRPGADPAYHRRSDLHTFATTYGYGEALLIDRGGNVLFRNQQPQAEGENLFSGPPAATPFASACRQALAEDRVIISDLSTFTARAQPAIFIVHPIHDAADQPLGLLAVAVPARQLDALGQAPVGLGQTGHTYLVGRDLRLRSQPRFALTSPEQPLIDTELTRLWLAEGKNATPAPALPLADRRIHAYRGPQETMVVGMASNLTGLAKYGLHWLLIAEIDKEEAFAAATNLWHISLLLLLLTMLFITSAALISAKRITAPIALISAWARQVARGNLSQVHIPPPPHELGLLYQSFRELVATLDSVIGVCEAIAGGDFTHSLTIKSEEDRFGQAINRMTINLSSVLAQVDAVAAGNYATVINPQSQEDRLGTALHAMTARLRQSNRRDERMLWFKTGASGLDNLMRGSQEPEAMSQKIIDYLTAYLGATVGVFYLAEENGCRATGAHGLARARLHPLALDDRLLQETVAAKRSRRCPQPGAALGLESGPATTVLITPLLCEGGLTGVVMLGAQLSCHPDALEFLDQVGDSIAITIHSGQAAAQIQELLAASRRQTETLQLQQEKLRRTNDELAKQAQLLRQSEEEVKNSNSQLARKARELEVASQYKSEFLANISHELRSPLNSLLILAQTLGNNEEGNLHPDQIESARIIHRGGLDLLHIINDILDLSKVEAGMLALLVHRVATTALVEPLRQRFQPLASQGGLSFATRISADFPQSLPTDAKRVSQILNNLLANAFKFTAAGSVTLEAHLPKRQTLFTRPELTPSNTVAFAVSDTGIGIAADKQQVIFEAFQQVDGSISREYGGTGLGLTISRQLTELLGGELHIRSCLGVGSTFTLYLPRELPESAALPSGSARPPQLPVSSSAPAREASHAPATAPKLGAAPGASPQAAASGDRRLLAAKKILLVDDDLRNTFALSKQLQQYVREVPIADNGHLALQLLAAEPDIDLVLMDIMMPVLDGIETIRAIRRQPGGEKLPIIALTAKAMAEDRAQCLAAGASDFLAKPVVLETLLDLLQVWLRELPAGEEGQES